MSNDSHTLQEFLAVLRRALLMIIRWIESNDPDVVRHEGGTEKSYYSAVRDDDGILHKVG